MLWPTKILELRFTFYKKNCILSLSHRK